MISVKNTFITITSPDSLQSSGFTKRNSLPTSTISLASFHNGMSSCSFSRADNTPHSHALSGFPPISATGLNAPSLSSSGGSPTTQCSSIKPCFFPVGHRLSEIKLNNTLPSFGAISTTGSSARSSITVDQNKGWCDKTSNNDAILPSIGSQLHYIGECNPCAFLHKARGCMEGYDCEFCHCCDKNDYITRKKIRAKKGKEIKRQAKLLVAN